MDRNIFFLDVISFFITVEQVTNPSLRGKPVIISPGEPRSPVLAASAEAREDGVERGMPLSQSLRLCPGLTVIPPNDPLYRKASRAVFDTLARFTPLIEPVGPGHAYLDMTGTGRLFGPPADTALRIRRELQERLRLASTVGLAPNKLLSNAAAHFIKPEIIFSVRPGEEERFLSPLPLHFIPELREDPDGKTVRKRLRELNLLRVGEVAVFPAPLLTVLFGEFGSTLSERSRGIDPRPVRTPGQKRELSFTDTFPEDTNDRAFLESRLRVLVSRAGRALRKLKTRAGVLTLCLRRSDHRETRNSRRFRPPADSESHLFEAGRGLLGNALSRRTRARSLEVLLSSLAPGGGQLDLFSAPRSRSLELALDRIRESFGEHAIRHGL